MSHYKKTEGRHAALAMDEELGTLGSSNRACYCRMEDCLECFFGAKEE